MKNSDLADIGIIAKRMGLEEEDIERYGSHIAKVHLGTLEKFDNGHVGKLIIVTAMTPTASGEGKTTVSIGLAQAIQKLGKKVVVALREPSLGPCFGVKGGATGGGKSTVQPMDRINLIFTADFPAISAAHNLLSAMINNHIHQGNDLGLDPKRIAFPRTVDMNDRSLRSVIVGAGGRDVGVIASDRFVITPASEVMAIVGLSTSYADLKLRLANIIAGYTRSGNPVFARDLNAHGAMAALLKYALQPNLVQTAEGVPAFIHTGPFGNIAHGTSSLIADRLGLMLSDYVVTETGFSSDLGAEKFINIVSRAGDIQVSAFVIVATIRALKRHGGSKDPAVEDVVAVERGMPNLLRHVGNIRQFGFEPVVAINRFASDTANELRALKGALEENNVDYAVADMFEKGGEGGIDLARAVLSKTDGNQPIPRYTYELTDTIEEKIVKIATNVYGAEGVVFDKKALADMDMINRIGASDYPVCIAKTQYSFSDDEKLLNAPTNFKITVRSINVSAGARFVIPMLGEVMTMPGLPRRPSAERIGLTDEGEITGLI